MLKLPFRYGEIIHILMRMEMEIMKNNIFIGDFVLLFVGIQRKNANSFIRDIFKYRNSFFYYLDRIIN